jgi:hypothetical protein
MDGRIIMYNSAILFRRIQSLQQYEVVSKSFRTESITKLTTTNTRWEATQRVMAAKLTRPTHKIAIQLHLMAESCTICSSRSRRPVRKLLGTPSYILPSWNNNSEKLKDRHLLYNLLRYVISSFVALFFFFLQQFPGNHFSGFLRRVSFACGAIPR